MKFVSVLNNYQMGSYAREVLSQRIVSETRFDRYHTIVVWEIVDPFEVSLLDKVLNGRVEKVHLKIFKYKDKWLNIYTGEEM